MQYARNRKKRPILSVARLLARPSLLTALALALSATAANAQLTFGTGSVPLYMPPCGGSIGWGPPGPVLPSLGAYFPTSYTIGYNVLYINGQLFYSPPTPYTDPSCLTGATGPTGGSGPTDGPKLDLFIQGGDGGGDVSSGINDDGPGNPPGGNGDGPNYPHFDAPINNLTVTPEPSTLLLLASGIVGLGAAMRRRRGKSQRHVG